MNSILALQMYIKPSITKTNIISMEAELFNSIMNAGYILIGD